MDGINFPEDIKQLWRWRSDYAEQRVRGNLLQNKPLNIPIIFWELFGHIEDLKMINIEANEQLVLCSNFHDRQNLNTVSELKKTSLRLNQILLHLKEIKTFYRNELSRNASRTNQEAYSYAHEAETVGELLSSTIEAKLYQLKEELIREQKPPTSQDRMNVDSTEVLSEYVEV